MPDNALRKAELLKNAFGIVNKGKDYDGIFRRQLLNNELAQLFSKEDLFEPLDDLDSVIIPTIVQA